MFLPFCQDLHGTIKRVSSFLQCPLVEDEVNNCVKYCGFSSMKDNKMVNYTLISEEIMDHSKGSFMRKGGALFCCMQINQSCLIDCVILSEKKSVNVPKKFQNWNCNVVSSLLLQWLPTWGHNLPRGQRRIKKCKKSVAQVLLHLLFACEIVDT